MRTILTAILAMTFVATSVFANDPKKGMDPKQMDPKMQEMMKSFMAYSTPGAEHKVLAGTAGKWTFISKMWQAADAKPEESKGTSSFKMILGGRYLQQDAKGKAMGMPFEGIGLTGYNNLTKKYETLWIDNMATGMMRGSGNFDEASHMLKDSGEFSCPMNPAKPQTYRTEWNIVDKNNMVFSMFAPGMDGKEYKNMELTFKRTK